MTTQEAIKQLQTEHDLIAGEHDLDGSQFAPALLEALAMAIEVLKCSEIPNCSEPKCADGCIYGWGSSECGHCDYRSEESKTGDSGFITCMNDEKTHDRTTGDCISRQAAADIIDFECGEWRGLAKTILDKLEALPSAQPEQICKYWDSESNFCALCRPSAQPEIVRCRECKHHDGIRCFRWNSTIITGFDDFCSNGERRSEDG